MQHYNFMKHDLLRDESVIRIINHISNELVFNFLNLQNSFDTTKKTELLCQTMTQIPKKEL